MLTWVRSSSNTCSEFGRPVGRYSIFFHVFVITDFFITNFLGAVVSHGKQAGGKKSHFLLSFA
jgi:hypothetical protein